MRPLANAIEREFIMKIRQTIQMILGIVIIACAYMAA
jgi:hypothetical protein